MMINCRHKNFPSLLLTGIKENYCLMCLDSKSFGGGRHPEHLASLSPGAGSLQPISTPRRQSSHKYLETKIMLWSTWPLCSNQTVSW